MPENNANEFTLADFGFEMDYSPEGIAKLLYSAREQYVVLRDSVSNTLSPKNRESEEKKAANEFFSQSEDAKEFVETILTEAWNQIIEKADDDAAVAYWFATTLNEYAAAASDYEEAAFDSFKSSQKTTTVSGDLTEQYNKAIWLRENVIGVFAKQATVFGIPLDNEKFPMTDGSPDLPKIANPANKGKTSRKSGGKTTNVTPVIYLATKNGVQRIVGKTLAEIAKEFFGGMSPKDVQNKITSDATKYRKGINEGEIKGHKFLCYFPDQHDARANPLKGQVKEFKARNKK